MIILNRLRVDFQEEESQTLRLKDGSHISSPHSKLKRIFLNLETLLLMILRSKISDLRAKFTMSEREKREISMTKRALGREAQKLLELKIRGV